MSASTKAFVLPVKNREGEIAQIKRLIVGAGCQFICDEVKAAEYKKCITESDVLVILICTETEEDPDVGALIAFAIEQAKRVVAVWIPGATLNLPSAINKYADACITLDMEAVKKAICGGESIWLTPDGKPRPKPKTPRHKG